MLHSAYTVFTRLSIPDLRLHGLELAMILLIAEYH